MYAVINLKWHQYIVSEWANLEVDNLDLKDGDNFVCEEVLAIFDEEGKNVKVWMPLVKDAKIECVVIKSFKWEKINVLKFKRKTRYKREIGFRPHKTLLEIKKIKVHEW